MILEAGLFFGEPACRRRRRGERSDLPSCLPYNNTGTSPGHGQDGRETASHCLYLYDCVKHDYSSSRSFLRTSRNIRARHALPRSFRPAMSPAGICTMHPDTLPPLVNWIHPIIHWGDQLSSIKQRIPSSFAVAYEKRNMVVLVNY